MHIVSFDIGKKNLAFCVEKTEINFTDELIIENVCNNGEIIAFANESLMKNCDTKKYFDIEVLHNLTKLLNDNEELFAICDVILIEQQMNRNTMALKIGQHCFSYFLLKYGRNKIIIEFPSYYKTQILNAPRISTVKKLKNETEKVTNRYMNKTERKKWAILRAKEILRDRSDSVFQKKIETMKKRDDVSDCILMIQAYKFLVIKNKAYDTIF